MASCLVINWNMVVYVPRKQNSKKRITANNSGFPKFQIGAQLGRNVYFSGRKQRNTLKYEH